jgi:hypothetical protein
MGGQTKIELVFVSEIVVIASKILILISCISKYFIRTGIILTDAYGF